ncbi:MAG: sulfide/dihydroorotate dehydrogenase-like FAD/NAD-binding protein [Candidatus Woesearchaeota archaeon]
MFKIIKKKLIAENTYSLEIEAPDIAINAKPGQFVMVMPNETGERIPLTIADSGENIITLIFIIAGKSTAKLAEFNEGDFIPHVAGPLGKPSVLHDENLICLIGGGVGIAAIYPIAKYYAEKGKKVHCILGVKSKKYLFWQDKFEKFSDKVIIASDDGSIGFKGNVVEALKNEIDVNDCKYGLVVAIGPTIMMKFVSLYTKEINLKTIVSLNTLMVDGMGMCGGCRIRYQDKIKFVCVDGPEFDAHKINFDEILARNATYKAEENHACNLNDKLQFKKQV